MTEPTPIYTSVWREGDWSQDFIDWHIVKVVNENMAATMVGFDRQIRLRLYGPGGVLETVVKPNPIDVYNDRIRMLRLGVPSAASWTTGNILKGVTEA